MAFDLVTLGETMIRLSPPVPQRLEQAAALEVNIGGAESNIAIALARLGFRAAWLSRLSDNAWGQRIARTLCAHGVDVSGVVWAAGERVGTYFVEYGSPPRPIQVLYDRADSAMSRMQPAEVAWHVVEQGRVVHCTGITPALSSSCAEVVRMVMQRARAQGSLVSFDLNYRSLLWPPVAAAAALDGYCHLAHLVFAAWRDLETLFDVAGSPEEVGPRLRQRWGCDILVITLGDAGSLACDGGQVVRAAAYPVEIVDRLGAGDAFDAGFIAARLRGRALDEALRYGAALSALCMTIPSDLALVSAAEVEAILTQDAPTIRR